jgi:hypothetical protein
MSVVMSSNYFEEALDYMGNDEDFAVWMDSVSQGIRAVVSGYKEETGKSPYKIEIHPVSSFDGGKGKGKTGFMVWSNEIEESN